MHYISIKINTQYYLNSICKVYYKQIIFFILLILTTTSTLLANDAKKLIIAPTLKIQNSYNTLKLNLFYNNNIAQDDLTHTSIGLEINPFWAVKKNNILSILSNLYISTHYDNTKILKDTYSSKINTLQADVKYALIDNKSFTLSLGAGFGDIKYNSLFIDSNLDLIHKKEQHSGYSYFISADIGILTLISYTSIVKILNDLNYLDNLYTTLEFKQYKIQNKSTIKYIDDYNYKVYNIGIKYKIPVFTKYVLQ